MKLKSILFIAFYAILISAFSQTGNISSKKELTKEQQKAKNKALTEKYKIQKNKNKELRKEINGSIIDDLSFEDINGIKHTSQSLKGKIVVINFWFIQCKPCVEEFPDLNTLKADFKSKPVEFIAVSWNDKNALQNFLKTNKLDFKVVPNGMSIVEKFKIPHYPYNIIIDQNGKVEYISDVLSFNVINKIKRKINNLL